MKKKLLFGFDPDVNKTGFACLDATDGVWLAIECVELLDIQERIEAILDVQKCFQLQIVFRLEDAGAVSATFGAYRNFIRQRQALRQKVTSNEEVAFRNAVKKVESKGRNQEVANWIRRICERVQTKFGTYVVEIQVIQPNQRQDASEGNLAKIEPEDLAEAILAKYKKTKRSVLLSKLDAERFKKITGCKSRTNEDVRDAACLLLLEFLQIKSYEND